MSQGGRDELYEVSFVKRVCVCVFVYVCVRERERQSVPIVPYIFGHVLGATLKKKIMSS